MILQSYTSSLTTSAAISAQNNFQGLILGGYIYRYAPRRYAPGHGVKAKAEVITGNPTVFMKLNTRYATNFTSQKV